MDFKYLCEDDTMVYILFSALVLHYFCSKAVEENLGQVKGGAFHKMIQNKLVCVGQNVL